MKKRNMLNWTRLVEHVRW